MAHQPMQQEMLRTDFCDIFITLKNEDKDIPVTV
jgi:hypothetical protein